MPPRYPSASGGTRSTGHGQLDQSVRPAERVVRALGEADRADGGPASRSTSTRSRRHGSRRPPTTSCAPARTSAPGSRRRPGRSGRPARPSRARGGRRASPVRSSDSGWWVQPCSPISWPRAAIDFTTVGCDSTSSPTTKTVPCTPCSSSASRTSSVELGEAAGLPRRGLVVLEVERERDLGRRSLHPGDSGRSSAVQRDQAAARSGMVRAVEARQPPGRSTDLRTGAASAPSPRQAPRSSASATREMPRDRPASTRPSPGIRTWRARSRPGGGRTRRGTSG